MKPLLTALLSLALFLGPALAAEPVSVMSKETLKGFIDDANVTILDARTGRDWGSSEFKIKSARRADPGDFKNWKNMYPKDRKLVLYCA